MRKVRKTAYSHVMIRNSLNGLNAQLRERAVIIYAGSGNPRALPLEIAEPEVSQRRLRNSTWKRTGPSSCTWWSTTGGIGWVSLGCISRSIAGSVCIE